ncbi:hypothetical protein MKW92_046272 [Papaver armeniacum]|nr:hypothetical protein MKW92_046272 [Papaver armeniacum]
MEDKTQLKPVNDSPSLHEELLHKPIVLACGHVSCFWCVHHAMDFGRESYCPICRREYNHFPSIYVPETYRRREKQLLEVEKKWGVFSPQLDLSSSCVNSDPKAPSPPTNFISGHETNSSAKTSPTPIDNSKNFVELSHGGSANSPVKSAENSVITNNADIEENTCLNYKPCKPVSINDALCITCKQMLFQPVILNCGHAYCESCLEVPENEALSCQLCQFPHPNGSRKIPQEYARRREDVQHKPVRFQQGTASSAKRRPLSKISQYFSEWMSGAGPDIHFGAGCDYCGMCPIVGERYQCKDCVESIGFDLCGSCYNTGSKRPGRFNQQHTEGHSFRLKTALRLSGVTVRLLPVISDDAVVSSDIEAPEDDSAATARLLPVISDADMDSSDIKLQKMTLLPWMTPKSFDSTI